MPLCLCFQPASYTIFAIQDGSNRSPYHYANMQTQNRECNPHRCSTRLWFAGISVSITKVGFVDTILYNTITMRGPVSVAQSRYSLYNVLCGEKMFITCIEYPCLLDDRKVNLASPASKKQAVNTCSFRVFSGRLRWLSGCCNFISMTALFYNESDF